MVGLLPGFVMIDPIRASGTGTIITMTMVIMVGRKILAVAAGKRVRVAGRGLVSSVCVGAARLVLAAHLVVHGDRSAHMVPARGVVSLGAAT